ncbi:hypothetical protein [Cyanobium sp. BA20m-14]|uniref:hypothetical protein n=1 Tax=Cyanobium sp. BA20m-14 TaxID=2823703 RepID=UPI0020CC72A6|nr:hypothetical protein [Cyanobium sp. BA20m-14]
MADRLLQQACFGGPGEKAGPLDGTASTTSGPKPWHQKAQQQDGDPAGLTRPTPWSDL